MKCYYCEESSHRILYFPDGDVAVCEGCLRRLTADDLMELLRLSSLTELLLHYGIARRHDLDKCKGNRVSNRRGLLV